MDDRVAGALAGGVLERVAGPDHPAEIEDREQQRDEDWQDEGELDERLTACLTFCATPAAAPRADRHRPCTIVYLRVELSVTTPLFVSIGYGTMVRNVVDEDTLIVTTGLST